MSSEEPETIPVPSAPAASTPLTESYTYHTPLPTAKGPYILGVDEAGRGPVLGPLVYGIAYCPVSYQKQMENMGFADSKTLNHETRSGLLQSLSSDPESLGWSVRVISPQAISNGMLRKPPINLNRQSEDATIMLIRDVLDKGLDVTEVFVDALGPTEKYQQYLSSLFPGIEFTVTKKADSKFKIVGAASVAAKVTRDACLEGWVFEETHNDDFATASWSDAMGSGYPSDPNTKAWINDSLEPTFGFPSIVRFSWTTVKVAMEKKGHDVKWIDENQASLTKVFETAKGLDKDQSRCMKDLNLHSVATF